MCGNRLKLWNTIPTSSRRRRRRCLRSRGTVPSCRSRVTSAMCTRPESNSSRPFRQRRSVDFPQPVGPMITTSEEGVTEKLIPRSASARPKLLPRPSTVISSPAGLPTVPLAAAECRPRTALNFGHGRLAWHERTRKARIPQGGSMDRTGYRMETVAVHSGEPRPAPEGSVIFPIYQGTVFSVEPGTDYHDIRYIRLSSTPTQRYLNDKLAAIEGAEAAVATGSGMAAVSTTLLAFLKKGDHLLAGDCLYGGTHDLLTRHADDLGLSYTFVDTQRPQTREAARRPATRPMLPGT